MIFIFLRLFMWLILFIVWVLIGGNLAPIFMKYILWLFGIQKIKVYGKIDESARIFAFNHPSIVDGFVLGAVIPNISSLMSRPYDPITWLTGKLTNSTFVSSSGNENTHMRLKKSLREDSKRKLIISAHKYYYNKNSSLAGLIPNEKMKHMKTIAFSLGERVQPVVIVYNSPKNVSRDRKELLFNLNWDATFANTVSVYLLPSTIQEKGESIKDFTERNRIQMDKCIERTWANKTESIIRKDNHWIQSQNIVTSCVLFLMVVLHALYKGQYSYAFAWLILMITSFIYWGSQTTPTWVLDQVMVWTVIVMGALLYKPFQIIPLITFITTALIYVSNIFIKKNWLHQLLHLISSIGHHSILFGL